MSTRRGNVTEENRVARPELLIPVLRVGAPTSSSTTPGASSQSSDLASSSASSSTVKRFAFKSFRGTICFGCLRRSRRRRFWLWIHADRLLGEHDAGTSPSEPMVKPDRFKAYRKLMFFWLLGFSLHVVDSVVFYRWRIQKLQVGR